MSEQTLLDVVFRKGALGVLFQPIVRTSPEGDVLVAVEGLIRGPRGSHLEQADALFELVRRQKEESPVDRACVATVLREARGLDPSLPLALNVHGSTLARDANFAEALLDSADANGIAAERVILDIHECELHWESTRFQLALEVLRLRGARIAVDDGGSGGATYRLLAECRPDFLKLDRHLVQGCPRDAHKRTLLDSLSAMARQLSVKIIAEGVEDAHELYIVSLLGADLVQGHLLARPMTLAELRVHPLYVESLGLNERELALA